MQNNEIRETVKQSVDPQESHKELLSKLLEEKRRGDWLLVGEMLGISSKNAEVAFDRVFSKHHKQVVESLIKVIENRKKMLAI